MRAVFAITDAHLVIYHLTIIPAIVKRYSRTSSPPALPALLAEQLTGGLFSIHGYVNLTATTDQIR